MSKSVDFNIFTSLFHKDKVLKPFQIPTILDIPIKIFTHSEYSA